jgi:hypothetical protein
MVSNKIKRSKTKRDQRRRQTKRKTRKTNAKSRKKSMRGGYYGTKIYDDKTYNGQIWPEKNNPHGNGMMIWNNGDVYDGKWHIGRRHGMGTMKWHNGRSYTGNWNKGKMNGVGSLRYANDKIVKGEWNMGNPINNFEIIWPNADPILRRTIIIPANEVEDFEIDDNISDAGTI